MGSLDSNIRPVLLLGVGNILQCDDGVGVHTVQRMRTQVDGSFVEVIDGGTAGLDLMNVVANRKSVIVVDAVDGNMAPGTLYRFTPEDISGQSLRMDSLHQIGLIEALQMSRLTGNDPEEVIIVGIQPAVVEWGLSLSAVIEERLPDVIERVRLEVETAINKLEKEYCE